MTACPGRYSSQLVEHPHEISLALELIPQAFDVAGKLILRTEGPAQRDDRA